MQLKQPFSQFFDFDNFFWLLDWLTVNICLALRLCFQ